MGFAKLFMFAANGCLLVTGIAVLTVGAVVLRDFKDENTFELFLEYTGTPIAAICIGSILMLVSLIGFFGAFSQNKMVLIAFAGLSCILFVLQLTLGIFPLVRWKSDEGTTFFKPSLTDLFDQSNSDLMDAFDTIQTDFSCCGVTSYEDYTSDIPASCCVSPAEGVCPGGDAKEFHPNGCTVMLQEQLYHDAKIIGGISLGLCIFELVGVVAAFLAMKSGKD